MNVTHTFEKLLAAFTDPRIRGVASKGGTRSGKTWGVLQLLHLLALNNPSPLVISCVAATLPMVKRGMVRDFRLMLANEGQWDENAYNKTEGCYQYSNGTVIEFFGVDNASKVTGQPVTYCSSTRHRAFPVKSLGSLTSVHVRR